MSSPPLQPDPRCAARRPRNVAALAIAFAVLLWVGVLLYLFSSDTNDSEAVQERKDSTTPPTMEILYNYDATDPGQLVSNADAVFVGRVGRRSGNEPLTSTIPGDSKPQSQYRVTVLNPVSGEIEESQKLTVNQIGGRSSEDGREYVVAGVVGQKSYIDSMLERGDEYLFVVARNPRTGFHDLTAQPQGKIPLSDASSSERREIISTFESAAQSAAGGSPSGTNSSEGR